LCLKECGEEETFFSSGLHLFLTWVKTDLGGGRGGASCRSEKRERDGSTGDTRESFLDLTQTAGSDGAVTSAQALLRMEGTREKQREAGDDAPRGGRNDIKGWKEERGRTRRERREQAMRGPPHISGCDFGRKKEKRKLQLSGFKADKQTVGTRDKDGGTERNNSLAGSNADNGRGRNCFIISA